MRKGIWPAEAPYLGIGERLWGPYVRSAASSLVALDPVARDQALAEGFDEAADSLDEEIFHAEESD